MIFHGVMLPDIGDCAAYPTHSPTPEWRFPDRIANAASLTALTSTSDMSTVNINNSVTAIPAADGATAYAHFHASLQFETDCADVAGALASGAPGFVLLDVRSPALFAQGHVPGAVNLPHGKMVVSKLVDYPTDTLFVTYCAGPHCNGATRGAMRLAQLGRPVKVMIGGITGWLDEGFSLTVSDVGAHC
jgi:rhodanese-related sulfurtransferase